MVQGIETRNWYLERKWKTGVFSQYPRPGVFPTLKPNSDKPRLKQIKIMGYSLRTLRYRYTEWALFDRQNFKPDWKYVIARELYDHQLDPAENMNVADRSFMSETVHVLSKQLRAGWSFFPGKDVSGTYQIGNYKGSRVILNVKSRIPAYDSRNRTPGVKPVVGHFDDIV